MEGQQEMKLNKQSICKHWKAVSVSARLCKRKAQLANWIRVKAFCAAINVLLAMLIGLAACRVLDQLAAGQAGAWLVAG